MGGLYRVLTPACDKIPAVQRTDPDGLTFRSFSSTADYQACVELQKDTWGRNFSDVVPLSILKITQKAGGIAAGAFSPAGDLLGFVYGLAGWADRRPFHWSHMLAVARQARDLGLGTRLKLFQRELLLPTGVEEVRWSFDPLEARNAHLNFNHLGAEAAEYVENLYEGEEGSELFAGIGTDRFILSWKIASGRVEQALADRRAGAEEPFRDAPVANPGAATGDLPDASRVRIEVPESIQDLKAERPDLGVAWRESTRRAFQHYLGLGYRVEAFYRDAGERSCWYGLEKESGLERD
jgi:predicted GNAT superfamily acetyltransferase